ncbi:ubiquitin-associated domain-containing protein 2-like, partial [Trifolium medium]|nr:ubiquitin-associated domain-containing protein 2-like [Trifolium medium]
MLQMPRRGGVKSPHWMKSGLKMNPSATLVTPGPYGLIFASFVPFFFDIPVSTRFRMFGFNFSDKSIIYVAGLQ